VGFTACGGNSSQRGEGGGGEGVEVGDIGGAKLVGGGETVVYGG